VGGRRVFFSDPIDRVVPAGTHPEQTVAPLDLQAIEAEIAQQAERLARRSPEHQGRIVRHRRVAHAQPVVEGTRIPVRLIQRLLDEALALNAILEAFPSLTRKDIDVARNWASSHAA